MKRVFINKVILSPADRNCSGSRCINKAEVLSRNTSGRQFNRAFTLVELLVVVLIIGILSAVAIPMYQGAVDKSHWSTMLPGAKAIKDAEEAIKMTNGAYTDEMANLDVTMNNSDLTFALVTPNNTADPNVIRVTNSKLNNVRLASYLDESPLFAGQLHCEALKNDERANRLCGKLLMGQELTEQDGYVGYLLDQDIDKATCDGASRSWSTSQTKCYKDTATRCEALNLPVLENYPDQCGYTGRSIKAEGACLNCSAEGKTIEAGGVCLSTVKGDACHNGSNIQGAVVCNVATYCGFRSTFTGGVCIDNAGGHWDQSTCRSGFTNGAVCFANVDKSGCSRNDTWYDANSCCCGNFCGSKPKCSAERCTEARAQYEQYFK